MSEKGTELPFISKSFFNDEGKHKFDVTSEEMLEVGIDMIIQDFRMGKFVIHELLRRNEIAILFELFQRICVHTNEREVFNPICEEIFIIAEEMVIRGDTIKMAQLFLKNSITIFGTAVLRFCIFDSKEHKYLWGRYWLGKLSSDKEAITDYWRNMMGGTRF